MEIVQMIQAVTAESVEMTDQNVQQHFENGSRNQHMIMIAFD
jgi:hypothetical protein